MEPNEGEGGAALGERVRRLARENRTLRELLDREREHVAVERKRADSLEATRAIAWAAAARAMAPRR